MADPYVLTFRPILKEKVWGGRRLAGLGKALPPGAMVGESWEVADLASTSMGGGGGGEARSIIAAGPLAGRTLHEATELWGERLLGRCRPTAEGGFPLLVKLLDAREHLSVQVHPSEAYARAHPGAHLKSECWYVLEAEPGSVIFKGLREGVSRGRFERTLREGAGEAVVELLQAVPAVVGDCHDLPSGTLHALGAGVLVAEVQTPSDTTFRVYDWAKEYGREGRELHVEQALASVDHSSPRPATRASGEGVCLLASSEHYTVEEMGHGARHRLRRGHGAVVMGVEAPVRVGACQLSRGGVALVPACLAGSTEIVIGAEGRALLFTIP